MSEKYQWTFDDDFLCCIYYIAFVFDNTEDEDSALLDHLVEALPHIKRGSIKMKLQNIKQVALDSGLEDRLSFSPLEKYTKQCKKAFDAAVEAYDVFRRSYPNGPSCFSETEEYKYAEEVKRIFNEPDRVILSQDEFLYEKGIEFSTEEINEWLEEMTRRKNRRSTLKRQA